MLSTLQHHEFSPSKHSHIDEVKIEQVDQQTYTSNNKVSKAVQVQTRPEPAVKKSQTSSQSVQWSAAWSDKSVLVTSISVDDINRLRTFEADRKAFVIEKSELDKARSNELKQYEKDKLRLVEKDRLVKDKDERISQLIDELKAKTTKIEELTRKSDAQQRLDANEAAQLAKQKYSDKEK